MLLRGFKRADLSIHGAARPCPCEIGGTRPLAFISGLLINDHRVSYPSCERVMAVIRDPCSDGIPSTSCGHSLIPSGEAEMVIERPSDKTYAFVLTMGITHYRTEDRGKTWRPFNMPVRPALVARPLSFHSDPSKYGHILYQGTECNKIGWGAVCHDVTYYTKEAFSDEPKVLLSETSRCQFARSTEEFKHEAHPDLIYRVAFDTSSDTGAHSLSSSRLFSSTHFFQNENRVEDLGIGKNARGVFAFAIVAKYAVVALKDLSDNNNGEILLYISVDTKTWAKAQFPHASSVRLKENGYTIVESTTHSLGVDVVLQDQRSIGTLFVSNSNGTFFVESLKDTKQERNGIWMFPPNMHPETHAYAVLESPHRVLIPSHDDMMTIVSVVPAVSAQRLADLYYLFARIPLHGETPLRSYGCFLYPQLISSIIAAFGNWDFTDLHGVDAGWIGAVWTWNMVWFLPLDCIEFAMKYAGIQIRGHSNTLSE
ncbi:hypothetical protein BT96DRAFT_1005008 [Gymnopus androsaceus JB14]|uniref:Sortilin N-terminal domain-containing protein n=1 Tax=Gymnopus androsaceus JB14 TaxID=1447944 RepID=A0A6A4GQK1_9AGAR|nr:hypothetical protein BT96DRAFT_1005008 [Gymnopus androsaceus JB14]